MAGSNDLTYKATGRIEDEVLNNDDIRNMELVRARRSLAYLKQKIGNDAMRVLLKEELDDATARTNEWMEASGGEWISGALLLETPGPSAAYFHRWFLTKMKNREEALFRAGHPDHFLNHPIEGGAEVIENVGEDDEPWHIFVRFVGDDTAFPTAWDSSYTERFGAFITDREGRRIGSALHELKDLPNGLGIKLTIHLPSAAPAHLVRGHLHHFAIEFRNWTMAALAESLACGVTTGRTNAPAS